MSPDGWLPAIDCGPRPSGPAIAVETRAALTPDELAKLRSAAGGAAVGCSVEQGSELHPVRYGAYRLDLGAGVDDAETARRAGRVAALASVASAAPLPAAPEPSPKAAPRTVAEALDAMARDGLPQERLQPFRKVLEGRP